MNSSNSSERAEETLLLNQNDIKALITMKDVIDICDKTFKGLGTGTTINPTKVTLDLGETAAYPPYEGFMNSMPAYVGHLDAAGMKFVGGFLGERKRLGLPYLTGLIVMVDPRTGNFTGILEGAHITNLRTGAQTAVALMYLNKPKSISVGIYGAGMQGHTQVEAISEIFSIKELRVYDINRETALRFKENLKNRVDGEIIIVESPEEAAQADVVITVTQAKDQFLKNEWIKPGTVVFPMGSYQECEDALIVNSDKIIVDHVEQALHRGVLKKLSAEGKITASNIFATIGELACGHKTITSEAERIICIPIGTGALDVAIAKTLVTAAKKAQRGSLFSFVD